jgi:transposase
MPDAPATLEPTLPDDPAVLQGMVRELLSTNRGQQRRIEHLEHRLDLLLKRVYGPRADTLNPDQPSLFGDPPPEVPPPPPAVAEPTLRPKAKGHGRRDLPANLRRETEVVDIPEAEKRVVGGTWTCIGEAVSEKLDYTPSSLFVRRIVRPKYVVRFDAKPDEFQIAALPPEALPKSKAAPGLVADVVVSKLVDHLPLYRQEKRYARQGIAIARSTLCGWLAEAANVLTPLYRLLKARVLAAKVVHTDDTPVPVQDPTREHCRTGRLWAYVSTGGIVYDATEDRCRTDRRSSSGASRGTSSATPTPTTTPSSRGAKVKSSRWRVGRMPVGSSSRRRRPARNWPTKRWRAFRLCTRSSTRRRSWTRRPAPHCGSRRRSRNSTR